jgi:hypothetical protein
MTQTEQLGLIMFLLYINVKFDYKNADVEDPTIWQLIAQGGRILFSILCWIGAFYFWISPVAASLLEGIK